MMAVNATLLGLPAAYQRVDEWRLLRIRRSLGHRQDDECCDWNSIDTDAEDGQIGVLRGTEGQVGPENGDRAPDPASWGAGASQQAHDQAEIVAGDMDEVAFLDIVATAQVGAAHTAAIESQGEAAFDDFGSEFEGGFGDA